MADVLFAIHPDYARKILSGEKSFEFRSVRCRRLITRIVIYATAPICCIVGETMVGQVLQAPPNALWSEVRHGAGMSRDAFDAYFKERPTAVAYQLEQPVQYRRPVPLADIGIKHPPQSFCYLSEEQYKFLWVATHNVIESSFDPCVEMCGQG